MTSQVLRSTLGMFNESGSVGWPFYQCVLVVARQTNSGLLCDTRAEGLHCEA